MSIEIKEVSYEPWGRCLRLTNGILEAIVTVEYGPRIVSFRLEGGKNTFFEDSSAEPTVSGPELEERYGKGAAFYRRGGHFSSLAPIRMPESFFPDNEPVVYAIKPDGVSLIMLREKTDGLKCTTELLLGDGASDMMVVHSVKNVSHERKRLSVWSSTALRPGGVEIIPQNGDSGGLAPNRVLAFWPGSTLTDHRLWAGESYFTLVQDEMAKKPFAMGTNNVTGWAAYVLPEVTFIKRYVHDETCFYPHHGCSFRTRVTSACAELDSFSPICIVNPGEGVRHVENLSLFPTRNGVNPTDEASVDHFMRSLY